MIQHFWLVLQRHEDGARWKSWRRRTASRAQLSESSRSELSGEQNDQLSFHVRHRAARRRQQPRAVPHTDRVQKQHSSWTCHTCFVLTPTFDNKATCEWISKPPAPFGPAAFMYSFHEVCQITMDASQSSSWGFSEASACVYWAFRAPQKRFSSRHPSLMREHKREQRVQKYLWPTTSMNEPKRIAKTPKNTKLSKNTKKYDNKVALKTLISFCFFLSWFSDSFFVSSSQNYIPLHAF